MSIASQINRLTGIRTSIITKLQNLGLTVGSQTFQGCANTINGISVGDKTITANGTYSPSGDNLTFFEDITVNVSGGASLTTTEVTPTESQQDVTPEQPYDGFSKVTVKAIPSNYTDVSGTTATESDVLKGEIFYKSDGTEAEGTFEGSNVKITGNGTTTAPEGVLYKQVTTEATVTTGVQTHTVTVTVAANTTSGNLETQVKSVYPNINIVGLAYVNVNTSYRHFLRLSNSGSTLVKYDSSTGKVYYRINNPTSNGDSFTITFGLLYAGVSTI